ncbi:MAG: hypothetical protein Ct9H300mP28_13440 [Pseudomonadota bacterium]|nr:MAG: hypothetical protein Ct9H300mP28_13440 [Pseudomonadota bacterium]
MHLPEVVYWMSESPAKLYKMHGKGRIEVGQDADLALIKMSLKKKGFQMGNCKQG